jgi:N-acetylmuramoyl-L-alanine amidase
MILELVFYKLNYKRTVIKTNYFYLLLFLYFSPVILAQEHPLVGIKEGDGVGVLFKRYLITKTPNNTKLFQELNQNKFDSGGGLILGKKYLLPIFVYDYDGKSIRSTLNNQDYDYALMIQYYNESLVKRGVKAQDFRDDKKLWIPVYEFEKESVLLTLGKQKDTLNNKPKKKTKPVFRTRKFPILGKTNETVKEQTHKLSGITFHLVSGHGGPDPGAIGKKNGNELHEDEYAYDVILRLGKKLAQHGADVNFIVQDPSDGIREEQILNNAYHEFYLGGSEIPKDQRERLHKRSNIVNSLFHKNQYGNENHHVVVIHVDSRPTGKKQIDIFFYHAEGSKSGEEICNSLLGTIETKYHKAQPNRGYEGTVSTRNLYMLNNTIPPVTFIELGNIKNHRDQQRILIPTNRQAIANWLCDGYIKVFAE